MSNSWLSLVSVLLYSSLSCVSVLAMYLLATRKSMPVYQPYDHWAHLANVKAKKANALETVDESPVVNVEEIHKKDLNMHFVAAVFGTFISNVIGFMYIYSSAQKIREYGLADDPFKYLLTHNYIDLSSIAILSTLTAYIAIYSCYGDFVYRKIDRYMLRAADFVAFIFGVIWLIRDFNGMTLALYLFVIVISYALMFFGGIGDSDSRAFVLLFAAGFPLFGAVLTYQIAIVGCAIVLLCGLFQVVKYRTFTVSIAMVPCILCPMVAGFFVHYA